MQALQTAWLQKVRSVSAQLFLVIHSIKLRLPQYKVQIVQKEDIGC